MKDNTIKKAEKLTHRQLGTLYGVKMYTDSLAHFGIFRNDAAMIKTAEKYKEDHLAAWYRFDNRKYYFGFATLHNDKMCLKRRPEDAKCYHFERGEIEFAGHVVFALMPDEKTVRPESVSLLANVATPKTAIPPVKKPRANSRLNLVCSDCGMKISGKRSVIELEMWRIDGENSFCPLCDLFEGEK